MADINEIDYKLGELSAGIEQLKASHTVSAGERSMMMDKLNTIENLLAPLPARLAKVEKTAEEYKSIRNRAAGVVVTIIALWAVFGDHLKQAVAKVLG